MKRKKHVVLIVPINFDELVAEVITQPIKPTRIPLRYPCIIYPSSKHCALNCFKKTKVQNMFQTKPTIVTTLVTKPSKVDNVPINVVVFVTTCNLNSKSIGV
jgi:hypothetical protein